MSVVINTNSAATMAANNLAQSSAQLQNSLNRLSSGSRIVTPADDAGGLAVSMKLESTAHRQAAVQNNIANSTSFLQTQDGVLDVVGKVLNRMSELKTMYLDPTKNSTDLANYNAEFTQLQAQLTSLSNEKFNGVSLFGSAGLNVGVTAESNAGTTVNVGTAALMGSSSTTVVSDNFANLSNWTNTSFAGGSASVSSNTLNLSGGTGGFGTVQSNQSFSGAFDLTLDFSQHTVGGNFNVNIGTGQIFGYNAADGATHALRIVADGSGNATAYLDGSSTPYNTFTGVPTSGNISISQYGGISTTANVQNFSISTSSSTPSNTSTVASASDLGSISLATISSAIQDVATLRANNGASQSRLGFAADVLTTNQANIEAANSRISDVDVAQESTELARYNVLVQSGTAMLSQANQSSQIALKLLG